MISFFASTRLSLLAERKLEKNTHKITQYNKCFIHYVKNRIIISFNFRWRDSQSDSDVKSVGTGFNYKYKGAHVLVILGYNIWTSGHRSLLYEH